MLLGAVASVAGLFTRGAVGLVTLPLCRYYLGPEAFAVWAVVQSISSYFGLSEAGIGQAVLNAQGRAYADHDIPRMNRLLASATVLYFGIVVPTAVLAFIGVGAVDLHAWLPKETSASTFAIVPALLRTTILMVLLTVPLAAFGATLSGARFHHTRQILDALLPLVTVLGLASTLALGGGIWGANLAAPAASIVWGVVAIFVLKRTIPELELSFGHFSWVEARGLLGHSMFFLLISFALLGNRSIPTLLTGKTGSQFDVGQIYAAALIFRVLGWSALDSITRVLQPYIVLDAHRGNHARVLQTTRSAVLATGAAASLFALVLLCFGSQLSALWLGTSGRISFPVIALLAVAFMLDVSMLPISNTLIALNRHRRLSVVLFLQPVLVVFGAGVLSRQWFPDRPIFGMLSGIVLASLITAAALVVFVVRDGLGITAREFARQLGARIAWFLSVVIATSVVRELWRVESLPASIALFTVALTGALGFAWRQLATDDERNLVHALRRRALTIVRR
ncbi:MAG: lipopolysaccharide biosynthesis protein [bacterium]